SSQPSAERYSLEHSNAPANTKVWGLKNENKNPYCWSAHGRSARGCFPYCTSAVELGWRLYKPLPPARHRSGSQGHATGFGRAAAFTQIYQRYSIGYGQTLHAGTRVDVGFFMNRNSSNNQFNTFNLAYSGTLNYSISQPLLRNYGRNINDTAIRIARNNRNISE